MLSSSGNSAAEIHSKNFPSLKWSSYQLLNIVSTYYLEHSCSSREYLDYTCDNRNVTTMKVFPDSECKSQESKFPSRYCVKASDHTHYVWDTEMDPFPAWSILAYRRKAFLWSGILSLASSHELTARAGGPGSVALGPRLMPPPSQAQDGRWPQTMIKTWTSVRPEALCPQWETQWHWAWARAWPSRWPWLVTQAHPAFRLGPCEAQARSRRPRAGSDCGSKPESDWAWSLSH